MFGEKNKSDPEWRPFVAEAHHKYQDVVLYAVLGASRFMVEDYCELLRKTDDFGNDKHIHAFVADSYCASGLLPQTIRKYPELIAPTTASVQPKVDAIAKQLIDKGLMAKRSERDAIDSNIDFRPSFGQNMWDGSFAWSRIIDNLYITGLRPTSFDSWNERCYEQIKRLSFKRAVGVGVDRNVDGAECLLDGSIGEATRDMPRMREFVEKAVDFIDDGISKGEKTLVFCAGGANRSPTVAAAYLMRRFGLSVEEAAVLLAFGGRCRGGLPSRTRICSSNTAMRCSNSQHHRFRPVPMFSGCWKFAIFATRRPIARGRISKRPRQGPRPAAGTIRIHTVCRHWKNSARTMQRPHRCRGWISASSTFSDATVNVL